MANYIANSTSSYTLLADAQTGTMRLMLSEDVSDRLREAGDSKDPFADALLAMGDDASAYLDAVASFHNLGDGFGAAYADGGMEGLTDALSDAATSRNGTFGEKGLSNDGHDAYLPDGFSPVSGKGLESVLDFGLPGGDAKRDDPSGDAT